MTHLTIQRNTNVVPVFTTHQMQLSKAKSNCFSAAKFAQDACLSACSPMRRRQRSLQELKLQFKQDYEDALEDPNESTRRARRRLAPKKSYYMR